MKYELVHWQDVKNDMKIYEDSDNNEGFVFGINVLDEDSDEVVDVQWFKTEQERADVLQENEEKL
tara:strand:- start:252 stop:446 length:195 start_codon:yes stop_codon:yes gene_type:complete